MMVSFYFHVTQEFTDRINLKILVLSRRLYNTGKMNQKITSNFISHYLYIDRNNHNMWFLFPFSQLTNKINLNRHFKTWTKFLFFPKRALDKLNFFCYLQAKPDRTRIVNVTTYIERITYSARAGTMASGYRKTVNKSSCTSYRDSALPFRI